MGSTLNRVVILKIAQNLVGLGERVSQSPQGFWNCTVCDLDYSTADQPLVLDEGDVRLDAGRVAVHHERDRPRRRDDGYLRVLETEPLAQRQSLIPRAYRGVNQILRNIIAHNLPNVGPVHADDVEEGFLVARVASERSQPLRDQS